MPPFTLQQPKNRELLGGDLVAQALRNLGCDVAFGLHGGHLDAFLVGAYDAGIRLIDTRHETTAVQAAEGYSKVSGKVGVCFITANSGYVHNTFRWPILADMSAPASAMASQALPQHLLIVRPSSASLQVHHSEMPRPMLYKASTTKSLLRNQSPNSLIESRMSKRFPVSSHMPFELQTRESRDQS